MRYSEPLRVPQARKHLLPPPPFRPPCRCRAALRGLPRLRDWVVRRLSTLLMNRTFCLFLLLVALRLPSAASEEEFVPWQSVTVTSPELPVVGIVTINASTQGGAYQKLAVGAFG